MLYVVFKNIYQNSSFNTADIKYLQANVFFCVIYSLVTYVFKKFLASSIKPWLPC